MKYNRFLFLIIWIVSGVNLTAQVTIGSEAAPHKGAVLELKSEDKGFLGSRIQLESVSSPSPIQNPAVGLLVFNIADNGTGEEKVEKNKYYTWSGSGWNEFIYEDIVEAEINELISKLGIPRSAIFHLNGTDKIDNSDSNNPVLGMFDVMKGATLGERRTLYFKETDNETDGNVRLEVNSSNSTLYFKKGTYSIVFSYQFIPSVNAFPSATRPIPGCTASSYFVDFPLERTGITNDRARIHNVAYHMKETESHHGGTIKYAVKIEQDDLPWKIELGAGQSGPNCNAAKDVAIAGFSLVNESTFILVSRIGD